MVNTSDAMGLWSHIGGYFIFAQIAEIPGVRWAHLDLGDPVCVMTPARVSKCLLAWCYAKTMLMLLQLRRYESFHTGFGPSGRATGFSVELLATLTRNLIADTTRGDNANGIQSARL